MRDRYAAGGWVALALTAALAVPATGQEAFTLDLAGRPLAEASRALAAATGLQVLLVDEVAAGSVSSPVRGRYTAEQALALMLAGTGYTWRTTAPGAFTLVRLAQAPAGDGALVLGPVVIEGERGAPATATIGTTPPPYAGGQVATGGRLGLLGNRDILDTPFSTQSYTEELIRNQGARTVEDVIRNDPAVFASSSGSNDSQSIWVRGVEINPYAAFAFDGLFGLTDQYLPPLEGIERVELIKGPNVLLNGFGSVAGFINLVPKRATDDPIARVISGVQTESQLGAHVDLGRRFGHGNSWGVRVNAATRQGDSFQDANRHEFDFGSLAVDYQGERFRLAADAQANRRDIDGFDYPVFLAEGVDLPDAPSGRRNLGQDFTYVESDHVQGSVRAEYDLLPSLTFFGAVGGSRYDPYYFYPFGGITNDEGDTLLQIFVDDSEFKNRTGETGLRGELDTGPIKHEFALVGSYWRTARDQDTTGQLGPDILSNIYRPRFAPEPSTGGAEIFPFNSRETYRGFAAADTLSAFDGRVALTAGARWQDLRIEATFQETAYDADRLSPGVGLVVKPLGPNLSLYANYVEGLESGGVVSPPAANVGEVLPAFVSKQTEIGVKYDFGSFGVTAAAFRVTRPNQLLDTDTNTVSADGKQLYRGLELNLFGEPRPGLRLLGGAVGLDPEVERSADGDGDGEGDFDGKAVPGAPRYRFTLYGEYDLPFAWTEGLTLTGRASHVAPIHYDAANGVEVPSVTLFAIGTRYQVNVAGTDLQLQAILENIFDEDYWEVGAQGGSLRTGAPRTFYLAGTVSF